MTDSEKTIEAMAEIIRADYKEWLDTTGCLPDCSSYYYECLGGAEDCAKKLYDAGCRKLDDVRTMEMQLKNGEIDMKLGSEYFQTFIWSVIQTFKQNGAKNFFTTTIELDDKKGERYALTIQKVGAKSPAQVLNEVRKNTAFEILDLMANVGSYDFQPLRNFDFFKKLCKKYNVEINR